MLAMTIRNKKTIMNENYKELFQDLCEKGHLKDTIFQNSLQAFNNFKQVAREMVEAYKDFKIENGCHPKAIFEYYDRNDYEFELRFAGDILIVALHTNVFEFSRYHEVMKTSYIKEDKDRSYCGLIQFYNFLADSIKYNRENDLGYLVGRIFVNKDMHYFVEGKKEIGLLYNNFNSAEMNMEAITNILKSAISYCVHFDLLTPPFDEVKQVSVSAMQMNSMNLRITTGKRLGFRFQGDHDEIK